MANTDLAVVASQLPAYLRGAASSAAEEFAGGLSAQFPLAFLSTRGKEFRLRKDGQELNTRQREISVVFIAARSRVSKRLYTKKYSAGSVEAPDCSSKDGITPDVAKPIAPQCSTCPKNQWGSRITEGGKEGKECQDYKRLVLWPVGLMNDPVVLDVAATSLKAPKGQQHNDLMLGDYLGQLAKHGMDPTQVVTKISFTDAEYPQLCFTFERFVAEAEFANVLKLRDHEDVKTVINDDVFEPAGEVKQEGAASQTSSASSTTAPAPETTSAPSQASQPAPDTSASIPPFPGTTTVMKNDAGELTLAEDENQYALAWAKGFRPAQTASVSTSPAPEPKPEPAPEPKPEPAPEPKPEPAPEPKQEAKQEEAPAGGGDDLLNAVASLLAGKQ